MPPTNRALATSLNRLLRLKRRVGYISHYLFLFLIAIIIKPDGLRSNAGRTIILGKLRRTIICCIPGLGEYLQRHYGLKGSCRFCGLSCNLIMQCPHWDQATKICNIYEDRPLTCRLFPITPGDLNDLRLAQPGHECGYSFTESNGIKLRLNSRNESSLRKTNDNSSV